MEMQVGAMIFSLAKQTLQSIFLSTQSYFVIIARVCEETLHQSSLSIQSIPSLE